MTADLESLITKEGLNQVFMAAWYPGKEFQVFDISQFGHNPQTMLETVLVVFNHILQGLHCLLSQLGRL